MANNSLGLGLLLLAVAIGFGGSKTLAPTPSGPAPSSGSPIISVGGGGGAGGYTPPATVSAPLYVPGLPPVQLSPSQASQVNAGIAVLKGAGLSTQLANKIGSQANFTAPAPTPSPLYVPGLPPQQLSSTQALQVNMAVNELKQAGFTSALANKLGAQI